MTTDPIPPEVPRAFAILHLGAMKRQFSAAADENVRFVHYTSAAAAVGIVSTKSIWMRNVTCMNDFSEIDYGLH